MNYDFKTLNDKEFEAFAVDIIGNLLGCRIERFKAGRDQGVDGRYYADDSSEVILQCKHWANTPVAQLISKLETIEKPKLNKLKPKRYLLVVSNSLSRADKEKILKVLSPYILRQDDIFGAEDLNDLLGRAKEVESRHYKLWLHSSNVLSLILHHGILGRSEYTLEEIQDEAKKYAVTEHHRSALKQLEALRAIIITGEPGIGKTTLASHLCIHYIAQGYQFISIADDIKQAEDVFDKEVKQIFYFDDFLGRNYLEALSGHEGKKITDFVRRIARDPTKRFVLTSRSTILNQGKLLIDLFAHRNLERNEYELRIASLKNVDRAHILFNHVWHSSLELSYVEEIYSGKRYRQIVKHRNFNPRLVSYITDATRLNNIGADAYWDFITQSLVRPAAIWENPFVAQQDDFGRAIILLVVLHRQPIEEPYLSELYEEYISLPSNQGMKGRREFLTNIKTLTGSFLNRIVDRNGVKIDLFNPSIADYVLRRYADDAATLRNAFSCLRNKAGLQTLRSLYESKIIRVDGARSIILALIQKITSLDMSEASVSYLSELFTVAAKLGQGVQAFKAPLEGIANHIYLSATDADSLDDCISVIEWALDEKLLSDEQALEFLSRVVDGIYSESDIEKSYGLLARIPSDLPEFSSLEEKIESAVIGLVTESISDFVDIPEVFSEFSYGEYTAARGLIARELESRLQKIGFSPVGFDYGGLLENFDLEYQMDEYFTNDDGGEYSPSSTQEEATDEDIDDIFERS